MNTDYNPQRDFPLRRTQKVAELERFFDSKNLFTWKHQTENFQKNLHVYLGGDQQYMVFTHNPDKRTEEVRPGDFRGIDRKDNTPLYTSRETGKKELLTIAEAEKGVGVMCRLGRYPLSGLNEQLAKLFGK